MSKYVILTTLLLFVSCVPNYESTEKKIDGSTDSDKSSSTDRASGEYYRYCDTKDYIVTPLEDVVSKCPQKDSRNLLFVEYVKREDVSCLSYMKERQEIPCYRYYNIEPTGTSTATESNNHTNNNTANHDSNSENNTTTNTNSDNNNTNSGNEVSAEDSYIGGNLNSFSISCDGIVVALNGPTTVKSLNAYTADQVLRDKNLSDGEDNSCVNNKLNIFASSRYIGKPTGPSVSYCTDKNSNVQTSPTSIPEKANCTPDEEAKEVTLMVTLNSDHIVEFDSDKKVYNTDSTTTSSNMNLENGYLKSNINSPLANIVFFGTSNGCDGFVYSATVPGSEKSIDESTYKIYDLKKDGSDVSSFKLYFERTEISRVTFDQNSMSTVVKTCYLNGTITIDEVAHFRKGYLCEDANLPRCGE